jgi:hypothetical protein
MSPEIFSEDKQLKPRPPEHAEPLQPEVEPPAKGGAALSGLQQAIGNRAVQRLMREPCADCPSEPEANVQRRVDRALQRVVQAKLTVGPANDAYEQEADHVADQVMSAPAQTPAAVQREGGQEDELQMKPLAAPPLAAGISRLVQREAAPDEEELQAKRLQRESAPDEEELQAKRLQREAAPEEEELQAKRLQRAGDGSFDAGAAVEERLAARAGSGAPLPAPTRSFMEDRFGADFSGVRVHTDTEAAQLSQDVSAQAFTHGGDVYFNAGKYDPGSADGQRLLAHELTHVVQQGAAKPAQRHAKPAEADEG